MAPKSTAAAEIVSEVPSYRVRVLGTEPVRVSGEFVLYWMVANRRLSWNYSLDRAWDWAAQLGKPLVVFEALRTDYPWASERIHHFVARGMLDNATRSRQLPLTYYPYLEPAVGAGRGALAWLAQRAAVVITDDFPAFFLPRMLSAAQRQIPVRLESVDSNGLWPMRKTDRVFSRAFDFRRFLQKNLAPHLEEHPRSDPSAGRALLPSYALPREFLERWPRWEPRADPDFSQFPLDHEVGVVSGEPGGSVAGGEQLELFLNQRLSRYGQERNEPEVAAASQLSAYLHFGHISAHEIFQRFREREQWQSERLNPGAAGSSSGWWGMSADAEAFLDELITWREIGYNMCAHRDDYDQYDSLPAWALQTLDEHRRDPRSHIYELAEFAAAQTHDPLWNAAQRQLVREGRIHNYLRMLWGKKILEWTRQPEDALAVMIELNNKYALDGRNPNSYSGIFWVLGRYDRAWGPERPVYGKIRYMSSDNTARKVRVKDYLKTYGVARSDTLFK